MLKKMQLLQSATVIGIAIGAFATPVTGVRANPLITTSEQQTIASTPNPRRYYGRHAVALDATIETVSGRAEIALAEHLAANDVKFYGAYWCSHCQKQKSLFGATAAAKLPYVECAADAENSQRQLCKTKNIKLFPTWVIKGQYFPGTLDLKDIAAKTGYKGPMDFKYRK